MDEKAVREDWAEAASEKIAAIVDRSRNIEEAWEKLVKHYMDQVDRACCLHLGCLDYKRQNEELREEVRRLEVAAQTGVEL